MDQNIFQSRSVSTRITLKQYTSKKMRSWRQREGWIREPFWVWRKRWGKHRREGGLGIISTTAMTTWIKTCFKVDPFQPELHWSSTWVRKWGHEDRGRSRSEIYFLCGNRGAGNIDGREDWELFPLRPWLHGSKPDLKSIRTNQNYIEAAHEEENEVMKTEGGVGQRFIFCVATEVLAT